MNLKEISKRWRGLKMLSLSSSGRLCEHDNEICDTTNVTNFFASLSAIVSRREAANYVSGNS
jgi:hypothetical protein